MLDINCLYLCLDLTAVTLAQKLMPFLSRVKFFRAVSSIRNVRVLTSRASRPRQSVSRRGPRDVEHFFDAGTGSDLFELGIDFQT